MIIRLSPLGTSFDDKASVSDERMLGAEKNGPGKTGAVSEFLEIKGLRA